MAVEMVLMTPVLVGFLLLVVAFGRFVWTRGEVEAAGRDGVRAASLQRDTASATAAAYDAVAVDLQGRANCATPILQGAFIPGGVITVSVTCRVSYAGLGLIGLPGSITVTTTSAAPLDLYRRTG